MNSPVQWPRGLRCRSTAARLLRLWVRIPPGAWMSVCCECCVLSGTGVWEALITRPEESYRLWYVFVCDLETSRMRRPWPALGRIATVGGWGCGEDRDEFFCRTKFRLEYRKNKIRVWTQFLWRRVCTCYVSLVSFITYSFPISPSSNKNWNPRFRGHDRCPLSGKKKNMCWKHLFTWGRKAKLF